MLPSIVAREIKSELEHFLCSSFSGSTTGFKGAHGQGLIEQFLYDPQRPHNLIKGPWLEVKLPFKVADDFEQSPLQHVHLSYKPYVHQQKAFERLVGATPQSTIVATGTGSGKTECFLYPILDYCFQERRPGIKAIIVYPMNALATDQARRFAKEIASLDTKLTVGLFTGEGGSESRVMSPDEVISHQDTLRNNPPDILLTNYKMLDFLLMRPKDQKLWKHNLQSHDLLRYLVVDELHTFDGAQGTDLACLIRRLRDKLQLQEQLACVGTSATIGGADACQQLAQYASEVFATPFTTESIILEERMSVDEYVALFQAKADDLSSDVLSERQAETTYVEIPQVSIDELLPGALSQQDYIRRQVEFWFGLSLDFDTSNQQKYLESCVELGRCLHKHTLFLSLLRNAHKLTDVHELAAQWQQDFNLESKDYALAVLDSLSSLISTARIWQDRTKKKVLPFLQVRVQLWLRELRRMLASVSKAPELTHADDLIDPKDPLHLPVVHCRECHSMAWGAVRLQGERVIRPDLQNFYQLWFAHSPDSVLLYPLEEGETPQIEANRSEILKLCPQCHRLESEQHQHCSQCQGELLRVCIPYMVKQRQRRESSFNVRSDDCPRCGAPDTLMILGSRAASLASVAIGQIYGSRCNDDHKLIAFSDSVQDAAHRAGFFGARTYNSTVRHALSEVVRKEGSQLSLTRFIDAVPNYWLRKFSDDANFVATFIAPNMLWLDSYQKLISSNGKDVSNDLLNQVHKRLRWEALVEFGLRSHIGRTLERSAVATLQPDSTALQKCVDSLYEAWCEELGQFHAVDKKQVFVFLMGFLHRLRRKGAFYDEALISYVKNRGNTYVLSRLNWLPNYGLASTPPAALSFKHISNEFESLTGSREKWYQHWFNTTIAMSNHVFLSSEYDQAMQILLRELQKSAWIVELPAGQDEAWLMSTERWQVSNLVTNFACSSCGTQQMVSIQQQAYWLNFPCLQSNCNGHYLPTNREQSGSLAYRAEPKRLMTSEHTGLLTGEERRRVEQSFIHGDKDWDVNLLSATPTLEMGIDIGDLSSVLLCSVPPQQANYLQRIGRAGRSNGNALALTIANGNNHDNYFYSDPLEMIAGDVGTPGIYLNAMAVLERQLIAYCFDCWVGTGVAEDALPSRLGGVLTNFKRKQSNELFPASFLQYVEENQSLLLQQFLRMFNELDEEGQAHLTAFINSSNRSNQDGLTEEIESTTLAWRILNRLQELSDSQESHRKRALELKNKHDLISKQPQDEQRDTLMEEIQKERSALMALIKSVNEQSTLNFFTDEGLLPNYAFPEEGVTLNSVILRRKGKSLEAHADGSKQVAYEQVSLKMQRPAIAALSELAPDNIFYASEHKLTIEQVDLKLSKPSEWRLCPSCHYSEDVTLSGDKHSACPRCGSPVWADIQQKRNLLKLRQVYARADSRYSRISDDSDQREPKFFQRQLLIDISPTACMNAMRIDNSDVPFGFEFVRNATFREVNFGEQVGDQSGFYVAGQSHGRAGFKICRHCGMVHRPKQRPGQFTHALNCKLSASNVIETKEDWLESLYLFRELKSEAIRILLPLADVAESEKIRRSLIAAINLGLKEYFNGDVQHLETAEMLEPSSSGNKQYLVIYDRVPGGTGYLKQLMVNDGALFFMFKKSLDHLSACSCASDESKDGCYRCILAYRNSRYKQDISRQAAVKILNKIILNEDKLVATGSLSGIKTDHILESELEARFISALRQDFKVTKQRVNNKPGYWLQTKEIMWEIEPQVDFGSLDGMEYTRADFVIRPVKESLRQSIKDLIVYTDGFEYHKDILSEDLLKRLSLLRAGNQVLSLTWDDLPIDEDSRQLSTPGILEVALNSSRPASALWNNLSKSKGLTTLSTIRGLSERGNFSWLQEWLSDPVKTKQEMSQCALAVAMLQFIPTSSLSVFVEEQKHNLKNWQTEVLKAMPSQAREWQASQGIDTEGNSVWQLLSYIAPSQQKTLISLEPQINLLYLVDDVGLAKSQDRNTWREFWQALNLLQHAPYLAVASQSGIESGEFDIYLDKDLEDLSFLEIDSHAEVEVNWHDVEGISVLELSQIADLKQITEIEPEVGLDIQSNNGAVAGSAELAWPEFKVAIFLEPFDELPEIEGWKVISLEDDDWLYQVKRALAKE